MRSIIDEHGVVAWIFDEYTHPKGLYYNKAPVAAPIVHTETVKEPIKKKK